MTPIVLAATAFALATIADNVTTNRALSRGAREANPIIAWIMRATGPRGWVVVKCVLAAAIGGALVWLDAPWVLGAASLLTALAAWHNHRRHIRPAPSKKDTLQ
jgi:hypothetical protein